MFKQNSYFHNSQTSSVPALREFTYGYGYSFEGICVWNICDPTKIFKVISFTETVLWIYTNSASFQYT
jgi:hypothetical protein